MKEERENNDMNTKRGKIYKKNTVNFNKKFIRKKEEKKSMPKKMKCYKWVIRDDEKDIEYS
jgi:hypothetical protein